MNFEPKVDLCFQVIGRAVPVDHGFALYGALSRVLPFLHEEQDVALKLIRGRYLGNGILDISPISELVLRIPVARLSRYISLSGNTLEVMGEKLRVGVPKTKGLVPSVALFSPLVTTKNGRDQSRFEAEIRRQMAELYIKGKVSITRRRTFQIHGKQVVGYSVLVSELTAEESIVLQENGLGGRRKMGCGFFEVWRR